MSVLGVGPAQSGKSTGLIVPAILEWQGPVLSTSIKADVVHDTHTARAAGRGGVRCSTRPAAPACPTRRGRRSPPPSTWEGARRTAASLLGVGDHGAARSADESFWRPAGAPLPRAAAARRRPSASCTMGDVLALDRHGLRGGPDPTELLASQHEPGRTGRGLDGVAVGVEGRPAVSLQPDPDDRDRPRPVAGARDRRRHRRREPDQRAAAARRREHAVPGRARRTTNGGCAASSPRSSPTSPPARSSAPPRTGRPIDPPLLLALDEAANIAPLPNLDEIASTGPGQGVQLLTILQNLSQAADRWGHDRAQTIIANHRARLFCSGIGDRATLDYLRTHPRRRGDQPRIHPPCPVRSPPGHGPSAASSGRSPPPHRIRQAHSNTALLVYGRLRPAWVMPAPLVRAPRSYANSSPP